MAELYTEHCTSPSLFHNFEVSWGASNQSLKNYGFICDTIFFTCTQPMRTDLWMEISSSMHLLWQTKLSKIEQPNTLELAQQMKQKLETLDLKFKVHHCALIDDQETLQKEQDTLDEHDEDRIYSCCTHTATDCQLCYSLGVWSLQDHISKAVSLEEGPVLNPCQGSTEVPHHRNFWSLWSLRTSFRDICCWSQQKTSKDRGIFHQEALHVQNIQINDTWWNDLHSESLKTNNLCMIPELPETWSLCQAV